MANLGEKGKRRPAGVDTAVELIPRAEDWNVDRRCAYKKKKRGDLKALRERKCKKDFNQDQRLVKPLQKFCELGAKKG